jgi:hypothetical protein
VSDASTVVLAVPLRGEHWWADGQPPRPVTILALAGSTVSGWQDGRTALVLDADGNLDWVETSGLSVTDIRVLPPRVGEPG